jgi:ribonuclease P protein component
MAASGSPPDPGAKPAPSLKHLKSRADFLRAARTVRRTAAGLTLEACPTPEKAAEPGQIRLGFTASRKVGNAVARNRAKRRLRAAAQRVLPLYGLVGNDYVLVARRQTLDIPFAKLIEDLTAALNTAHARLGRIGRQVPARGGE